MNKNGFSAGISDGFMGLQTQTAIIDAERTLGLAETGKPSIRLLYSLRSTVVPSKPCPGNYDAVKWTNCQGTRLYPDGDKYTGGFLNGKPHGAGLWIYKSGREHQGHWVNGTEVDYRN